jgi:hypothetical protein
MLLSQSGQLGRVVFLGARTSSLKVSGGSTGEQPTVRKSRKGWRWSDYLNEDSLKG